MKKILLALVLFASGCVPERRVIEAVSDAGYTSPQILDRYTFFADWHGCTDGEEGFLVEATNATGKRVRLTACAGRFLKGVTIRH